MVVRNLVIGGLVVAGLGALVYAVTESASPYVEAKVALQTNADNLHVAGTIVPGTLQTGGGFDASFSLKDDQGTVLPVRYVGSPPANLATATKVVAIGGMKDGVFRSEKLLVKCPSKYESASAGTKA